MILISILCIAMIIYGFASVVLSFISFPKHDYDKMGNITGTTEHKIKLPFGIPAAVVGIVIIVLSSTIVKIGGQDAGVLVTPKGVSSEVLHTGWHFVAPWNDLHKMDKTVWVYTCSNSTKEGSKANADAIWAPTKDGIKLGFDVSVSWKIDATQANWIYSNISENDGGNSGRYLWIEENVIRPKLKSIMALTVSEYSPIDAYSNKRQEIQDKVIKKMREEIKGYKLILEQVDIREIFYNSDYEKALNQKKLAEQEVLRLIEVTKQKAEQLKQASIDKDMKIQEAEGEAKALQIKGNSISSNPKIIQLQWIEKWDGALPTYMMGDGKANVMLNLGDK